MFRSRSFGLSVLALALLAGTAFAQSNSQQPLPARYTAFAVSTGDAVSNAVASQVEIAIDRWSSAAESARLLTILKEKGADALLDALQDLKPVGSIKTPRWPQKSLPARTAARSSSKTIRPSRFS